MRGRLTLPDRAPTIRATNLRDLWGTVDQTPSDTPASSDAPTDPGATRRRARLGCAVELIETLVLTLVIFFGIQTFIAQPFMVEGSSMDDTFAEGDYVLVDRLSALWSPYPHGQVVVFHPPASWTNGTEPYIKRVIGVGGDTVEVRPDGSVAVNGAVIDEPYLFRNDAGLLESTQARDQARWVVPEGELFVMGDHRQASADSRVFGPIPVSSVIGRGVVRYWPLSDFGLIATPSYENVPAP
jgi:signal peptidase I